MSASLLNLHLAPHALIHGSRINRTCRSVSDFGVFDEVVAVGTARPDLPVRENHNGFSLHRLSRPKIGGPQLFRKIVETLGWSIRTLRAYWHTPVACVNTHSLAMLPLGVVLKARHRAVLIYDTHELETDAGIRGLQKVLYEWIEHFFIPYADYTVCVSSSIARWYHTRYGIAFPTVVPNIPESRRGHSGPKVGALRRYCGVRDSDILFIYQGLFARGRRLEQLVRVFARAKPDRHIVFMGFGELEPLLIEAASRFPNIHHHPAVAPSEILDYTSGADIGVHGGENICLSYYLSLPNKLFEYLAAGLPVMVPNWPEMAALVGEDDCGWIVEGDNDGDWQRVVNAISHDEIAKARVRTKLTSERHSWAEEERSLRQLYNLVSASVDRHRPRASDVA